jgi:molybdopterin converting factor small subunit
MPVTFYIPGPLRVFSGGLGRVEIQSSPATLRDAFEALYKECPGIRDRLVNEEGQVRDHINIFIGSEDIRSLGDFSTPLPPGAEISILPAISGG